MGIITLALVTGGVLAPGSNPPVWVIVSAGMAIALGTYLGGWRIIRTMGSGLTDLTAAAGLRRPDQRGHGHPGLLAPRLLALHHPVLLRRRDGCGPRPQGRCGPLVHRDPDVRRLGPDPAGRRSGRRGRRVPHQAGHLGCRRRRRAADRRVRRHLAAVPPPAGRSRRRRSRRRAGGCRHHRHRGRHPAARRGRGSGHHGGRDRSRRTSRPPSRPRPEPSPIRRGPPRCKDRSA